MVKSADLPKTRSTNMLVTHVYIYIYIYICVYVCIYKLYICICVCIYKNKIFIKNKIDLLKIERKQDCTNVDHDYLEDLYHS